MQQGDSQGFPQRFEIWLVFVYVIAWVAVVFGINCVSNVGRKLVIVGGAALLLFPAYIMRASILFPAYIYESK